MSEKRIIDIPFVSPPMMRMIIRIDESHEDQGVTVIDKCEIEEIYVPPEPQSLHRSANSLETRKTYKNE